MMGSIVKPAPENFYLKEHIRLLRNSYSRLLQRPLTPTDMNDAQAAAYLYKAPMVLLSHNTDADPVFNYANRAGMNLFELSWGELVILPSRMSAQPLSRKQRQHLLDQVTAKGFIDNYQGIRISKTGKRFKIKNAVVWNLLDEDNIFRGQAACFSEWDYLLCTRT